MHRLIALIALLFLSAPSLAQTDQAHGAHVSFVERGVADGPAVILIPGLASPRAVWDGIVPRLERDHRVILVQISGFGAGEDGVANASPGALDAVVAEIAAYIGEHRVTRPAIIGHSMGGLTALLIAQRHPDLADRILIVDSLPFIGSLFMPGSTVESIRPMAERMRDGARRAPRQPAVILPDNDPGGIMSITAEGRRQVAAWSTAADPAAVAQIMFDVMQTDARAALPATQTPITLLYPTSAAVPDSMARPLYEQAYAGTPHLTMVEIPGSYHFIMLDQPDRFAAAVDAFLAE